MNNRMVLRCILALIVMATTVSGASAQTPQLPATPNAIQLTGAGATFPFPLYSRWFYEYTSIDNSVRFNYQSIGSGGGIRQITAKTVDFGASDAILNEEQRRAAPGLEMFPTVAGAVVLAYNLKEAEGQDVPAHLKLTPSLVADIFLGKVTQWNDDRLVQLNPEVKMPHKPILVVHRSDGSGTTFLFTSYLSQVSEEWKSKVGASTSVNWPTGVAGKGNEGVAGILKQQPNSIGYVELAYAVQNKMPFAAIQNQAGQMIVPTLQSVTAASDALASQMPEDLGQLLVNAPGNGSYPIAGYTFLLMYKDSPDCQKAQKLAQFLAWALSSDGDKYATDLLYAPLAPVVKAKVLEKLTRLTCEGGKAVLPEQEIQHLKDMASRLVNTDSITVTTTPTMTTK